jgi:hypothetical protein
VRTLLVADSFEPRTSFRCFSVMMPALVNRVRSESPGVRLQILPWQSVASIRPDRFRSIDLLISCSAKEVPGFQRETLFTDTEVASTTTPVIQPASPDARKTAAHATSSGVPRRLSG